MMSLTSVLVMTLALGHSPAGDAAMSQTPSPPRVTVEMLKSLKSTANDPAGDQFGGTREELTRLIDAVVLDASLLSPTYLFLTSKTAFNLGRLGDAAFLFYAAQLRTKFDLDRYELPAQAADSPAIYFGFLRQTIGESVNPAVMREPAVFSAVVKRLESWEIVPSPQAFYPDFGAKAKFKLPPEKWAAHAAGIKKEFMSVFGRQVRLLNDPEYFQAFRFVQSVNFGEVPSNAENRARFEKSLATMDAVEKRLFPDAPGPSVPAPPKPPSPSAGAATAPSKADLAKLQIVRAGDLVPVPKILRRVEPEFPPGEKGTVIMEVTIGPDGSVTDVRVLRGYPALDAAAIKAVRQWQFEISRLDGRPVSVVYTATLAAR